MAPNKKSLSSYAWILWTIIFVLIATSILMLMLWKPLVGCATVLLLLLTLFVGSFMKAYTERHNNSQPNNGNSFRIEQTLTKDELKRSQLLLRYATAILAFLSLLTTAEGLQGFVFDSDKGWMAYLGSFAVQGILVVFSLMLCRFFVFVNQLKWPGYIKTLANGILVIFFCVALIVSSTFSFSYIANNAYQGNWLSDSEMIIQTHLTEAANELRRENDLRGEIILANIRATADEKLEEAIENVSGKEKDTTYTEIEEYISMLSLPPYADASVVRSWELLYQTFPRYEKDIDLLANEYDTVWLPKFEGHVSKYNTIAAKVKGWNGENISSNAVVFQINDVSSSINQLKQMVKDIEKWKSHKLNNDISAYRSTYQSACSALIEQFNALNSYLEHIHSLTEQVDDLTQSNLDTDLNSMLSKVYLLGIDDTISVVDISKEITDLALKVSVNEEFSSEDMAKILELRDLLVSYNDYKELEAEITDFLNSNLQNNYQVTRETDEEKKVDSTETTPPSANGPTEPVDVIDESGWRKTRSNDFNEFYKMVKSLPTVDDDKTSYNETEVILEASQIHRDLLGETTEFEKAFNFFKYRFPFMAFFSAFIAVFFDLGSFLTGCFLYVTEFFKPKHEDKQPSEENKPDQDGEIPPNQPNE